MNDNSDADDGCGRSRETGSGNAMILAGAANGKG